MTQYLHHAITYAQIGDVTLSFFLRLSLFLFPSFPNSSIFSFSLSFSILLFRFSFVCSSSCYFLSSLFHSTFIFYFPSCFVDFGFSLSFLFVPYFHLLHSFFHIFSYFISFGLSFFLFRSFFLLVFSSFLVSFLI